MRAEQRHTGAQGLVWPVLASLPTCLPPVVVHVVHLAAHRLPRDAVLECLLCDLACGGWVSGHGTQREALAWGARGCGAQGRRARARAQGDEGATWVKTGAPQGSSWPL